MMDNKTEAVVDEVVDVADVDVRAQVRDYIYNEVIGPSIRKLGNQL